MTVVHIAPNTASGAAIRAALDAAGDDTDVIACGDDLSCGPIDRADRRDWWATAFTGDMGRNHLLLWDPIAMARVGRCDVVVWVGRRSAQERCCLLHVADAQPARQVHVIDVDVAAALSAAAAADHVGSERGLGDDEHAELARQWSRLRAENAAYRVLTRPSELVSAPPEHFDGALLAHVGAQPRPMAAIIADAMAGQTFPVADYVFQQRLITLADAGTVIADGDPRETRTCTIRMTP